MDKTNQSKSNWELVKCASDPLLERIKVISDKKFEIIRTTFEPGYIDTLSNMPYYNEYDTWIINKYEVDFTNLTDAKISGYIPDGDCTQIITFDYLKEKHKEDVYKMIAIYHVRFNCDAYRDSKDGLYLGDFDSKEGALAIIEQYCKTN